MESLVKWLGTKRMAEILVPVGKVKIIPDRDQFKVRDSDLNDHTFSPSDLVKVWSEKVHESIPDNWGWVLAKLQRTGPGVVVNSTYWYFSNARYAASGTIYHWNPEAKTCSCPAFRRAWEHRELLLAMGETPWCKHLTLLDGIASHFLDPHKDPHGIIRFGLAEEFVPVGLGRHVHRVLTMEIQGYSSRWEFPQTLDGFRLLEPKLQNAHAAKFQIVNYIGG